MSNANLYPFHLHKMNILNNIRTPINFIPKLPLNTGKLKLLKPKVNASNGQSIFNFNSNAANCIKLLKHPNLEMEIEKKKEKEFIQSKTPLGINKNFNKISELATLGSQDDIFEKKANNSKPNFLKISKHQFEKLKRIKEKHSSISTLTDNNHSFSTLNTKKENLNHRTRDNTTNTTHHNNRHQSEDETRDLSPMIHGKNSKSFMIKSESSPHERVINRSMSNKKQVIEILNETIKGLNKLKTIILDDEVDEDIEMDMRNESQMEREKRVKNAIRSELKNGINSINEVIKSSTTGELIRMGNKKIFNIMNNQKTIGKTIDSDECGNERQNNNNINNNNNNNLPEVGLARNSNAIVNSNKSIVMNAPTASRKKKVANRDDDRDMSCNIKKKKKNKLIDNGEYELEYSTNLTPNIKKNKMRIEKFEFKVTSSKDHDRYDITKPKKNSDYDTLPNFEFSD